MSSSVTEKLGDGNAVGDYSLAKRYEVYRGQAKGRVVQATKHYAVYPWLVNLKVYDGKRYNYVITKDNSLAHVTPQSLLERMVGYRDDSTSTYASVRCGDVNVIYYPTGSTAYKRLNEAMSSSLQRAYRLSEENNMPKYFGLDK